MSPVTRHRWRGTDVVEDQPLTFLEHLVDLRRCVIRCVISWLAATLLSVPLAPWLLRMIMYPLAAAGHDPAKLVRGQSLGAGFAVLFQIMLWGGLLLSLPLLLFFLAQFIFPGLTLRERRTVRTALLLAGALFIGGLAFCYRAIMPQAVQAFFVVNEWMGVTVWPIKLEEYVDMIVKTVLAFGLAFEMPLALLAMGWMGVLPARVLRDKRRHAIVAIAVIAMVMTPPDVVSMMAMGVPMYVMFEGCVLLIAAFERRRRRSDA